MNRNDLINMAKECGPHEWPLEYEWQIKMLNLAKKMERERCVKLSSKYWFLPGYFISKIIGNKNNGS